MEEKQCCEIVGRGFNTRECTKPVKVTYRGKHYCKVHDPERRLRLARERQKELDWREVIRKLNLEISHIEYVITYTKISQMSRKRLEALVLVKNIEINKYKKESKNVKRRI